MERVCETDASTDPRELDHADANGEDDVRIEVPEAFRVYNDATANWVINLIIESRARATRAADWAERIKRRSQSDEHHLRFLFEGQLRDWLTAEIAKSRGRRKSVALPAGTIGYRLQKAALVIDDERVVLDWARTACPSAIMVTERISKTAINDHVTATGEMPEAGIHLEPQREHFFIR